MRSVWMCCTVALVRCRPPHKAQDGERAVALVSSGSARFPRGKNTGSDPTQLTAAQQHIGKNMLSVGLSVKKRQQF